MKQDFKLNCKSDEKQRNIINYNSFDYFNLLKLNKKIFCKIFEVKNVNIQI